MVIAQQARARMQAVMTKLREGEDVSASGLVAQRHMPGSADVVITACEVSPAHGTGTLLLRIFPDSNEIVSLRTSNFYDGQQAFGAAQFCLPLAQSSRPEILSWVKWCLVGTKVRRILVLPYLPADPLVALAVHEVTGAPMCTYIMDDKNVCADGIDDRLMQRLLEASQLRLVISPEMRDAYIRKYHCSFFVVPPLVPEALLQREPVFPAAGTDPSRGILLGNMWGQRWLDMLRTAFRGSGYTIDWFCNQKDPAGLVFDRPAMREDGIVFNDPVPESALPDILRRYAYAIVPTDLLDGASPPSVRAIAELSLPSRIPTMVAMSHIPVLVIGSPETCAARFVSRFGLGMVVPYETAAVTQALRHLTAAATQADIRARAASLAGQLSAEHSAKWIWRSLAAGGPCDMRYETLMRPEPLTV
jgi:hypothetical protein